MTSASRSLRVHRSGQVILPFRAAGRRHCPTARTSTFQPLHPARTLALTPMPHFTFAKAGPDHMSCRSRRFMGRPSSSTSPVRRVRSISRRSSSLPEGLPSSACCCARPAPLRQEVFPRSGRLSRNHALAHCSAADSGCLASMRRPSMRGTASRSLSTRCFSRETPSFWRISISGAHRLANTRSWRSRSR